MYLLYVNFEITFGLLKLNICVRSLNILHKNVKQNHNYVNELILARSGPFDIKCKKRNAKNLWECIFRASRMVFHNFPRLRSIMEVAPQYLLKFLWIILRYSVQALCKIQDGAFCDKK